MKKKIKRPINALLRRSTWQGILLVVVASLTLEATAILQMHFSNETLKKEALLRAESSMDETKDRIMEVVTETEAALRNSVWIAQWCLYMPDSLRNVSLRIVQDNPTIVGSTVALVPGYRRRQPLMAPFAYSTPDGSVHLMSLATEAYDYPSHEWFKKPLEVGAGYWSEPYYDTDGSEQLIVTYSIPVEDRDGRQAAVITADVSLEWLHDRLGRGVAIYPSAFGTLISRGGKVMMCPVDSLVMRSTVRDYATHLTDTANYNLLADSMLAGEKGMVKVKAPSGKTLYVYYSPVERTGWSMSMVIPEDEIYADLKRTSLQVFVLQILGLLMLIFILRHVARSQIKFQETEEKRQNMESELRIGRDIQMSMIPKAFPPFPERTDIDMAATIVPAKEVGGDLYDFYIRDEKLFFCIGDVSGKGVPASLLMAVTRSLFRNVSAHENNPARIVSAINDSMADVNENNMFVTFFLGILDMKTGQLDYCNAGHNPPLILTDKVEALPVVPNVPLAVAPGMVFEAQHARLSYDDAIFLYTDGVTEAENEQHKLFGMERMEKVLHMRRPAEGHLKALRQAVGKFVGGAAQSDDITMLFIRYLPDVKEGALPYERRLVLHNDIQQIPQLATFVEDVARDAGIQQGLAMSLNLALEEAVTNVILYAYPTDSDSLVDVEAIIRPTRIDFIITDSGKPFDPTAAPEADISLGVEERAIGGLGIHLVRTIMDSVKYARVDRKNILTMTKKL